MLDKIGNQNVGFLMTWLISSCHSGNPCLNNKNFLLAEGCRSCRIPSLRPLEPKNETYEWLSPRGGTLTFSGYIGSAPASTAYPQKIPSLTDYPKKIPSISGIPKTIIEILAYPQKIINFLCIDKCINFIPEHNAVRSRQ